MKTYRVGLQLRWHYNANGDKVGVLSVKLGAIKFDVHLSAVEFVSLIEGVEVYAPMHNDFFVYTGGKVKQVTPETMNVPFTTPDVVGLQTKRGNE